MDIQAVYDALQPEFAVMLQRAGDARPIDGVVVLVPTEQGSDLVLDIMFMPGMEEHLSHLELLQLYIQFPIDLDPSVVPKLRQLLLKININLPLPSFGLHEEDDYLYFKYMLGLPRGQAQSLDGVVLEAVRLVTYQIRLYLPLIYEVLSE
ncbi:MAG: hypothetical protein HN348_28365 [Proteobacteria bacterium]|jgi:hypothetical protein|nr:hypothetical protein [Pseudomonadota bacterium]